MIRSIVLLSLVGCGRSHGSDAVAEPAPAPVVAADPVVAPTPEPPAGPKDFVVRRPAFRFPGGVTAVSLDGELPTEVEVSLIPNADLVPAVTRSVATKDGKRRLVPIEFDAWKALTLPGRSANGPYDVVVLWPASPAAHRIDAKGVTGLPPTITPATITMVVDRDGDDAADFIWADWCCGDQANALAASCTTPCGELWERKGTTWGIRERSGSSGGEAAPEVASPAP